MDLTRGATNLRREVLMLALVVALVFLSSWVFDQRPLSWINVLFVLAYVAHRAVRVTTRRGAPAER
jgi:hypothetical protein